jgi:hypothetical protein
VNNEEPAEIFRTSSLNSQRAQGWILSESATPKK